MIMKKRLTIAPATAFGYNWQIRATSMAQATPPRKPFTFEYIARPAARLVAVVYVSTVGRTICPQLDASKGVAENRYVGNKTKDFVRNTRA
jgi:hypothetical protein